MMTVRELIRELLELEGSVLDMQVNVVSGGNYSPAARIEVDNGTVFIAEELREPKGSGAV